MQSIAHKVLMRVRQRSDSKAFSTEDFRDLGNRNAIDQALSRLARKAILRRVSPGIYDLPSVSPRLGTLSPDMDAVARAMARKNKVHLQPAGALAANALGVSTQVPAARVYFVEGFPKKFRIGRQRIDFRHGSPRNMAGAGRVSGVVFQAIRHLGKRGITDDVLRKIGAALSPKDKQIVRQDAKNTFGWIRDLVPTLTDESATS